MFLILDIMTSVRANLIEREVKELKVWQVGQLKWELGEPVARQLALSDHLHHVGCGDKQVLEKPERSKTSKRFREVIKEIIRSRKHLKSFNIS